MQDVFFRGVTCGRQLGRTRTSVKPLNYVPLQRSSTLKAKFYYTGVRWVKKKKKTGSGKKELDARLKLKKESKVF